jgi:Leucine-rich repeat (LRR) protein
MKIKITQLLIRQRFRLFAIALMGLTLLNTAQAQTPVNQNDSLALVSLYIGSAGTAWTDDDNWLTGPVATWQGVGLDGTGTRIVELDLSNNNLSGQMPNFDLSELRSLSLANNNLSGQIPNFSNMPLLQYLDLSANSLSGAIPNFTTLTQLQTLQLTGNNLSTLPNFTNLPNLQIFSAEYNQLTASTTTFPSFSLCPQLQILELSGNLFAGSLPTFNLPQLTVLRLADNQFSGTLPSFSGTPNLQMLVLTNNLLSGTIPNLVLPQLQELYLDYNDFTGTLPTFSTTPNLIALFLSGNNLSGTVPSFVAFSNLTILFLDDNAFTFAGMEANALHFDSIGGIMVYDPQAEIPLILTSNATLSVNAGGNMANNTYIWYISGSSTPVATIVGNNTYTPNASGSYYCVVTNSQATQLTLYSTSAAIVACSASVSIVNSSCVGINNGALTAVASNSSGYAYLWSNGATTATINNLAAGTYYLTVTGAGGCYATASATVNNLSNPNFNLIQTSDSYCNAQLNSLTLPLMVQTGIAGTYTVTAVTSLQTVTVNVNANVNFNLNLLSETPSGENITITTSNAASCSKDTVIVNDKCCRIMQEGILVASGPIEKNICPNTPANIPSGCAFKFVVTDYIGTVKLVLNPDAGQCISVSNLTKQLNSISATVGKYHIYGYKQCTGATPIVVGDVVDCPNPLEFYYQQAGLLVRLVSMNTILRANNLLPLNQPFNTAPWDYNGTESIASAASFNGNTVDWLLLELRDSVNNNIIVARRAALLLKNGTVVDVLANGTMAASAGVHFVTFTPTSHHYLAVRHRNHLAVMSSSLVALDGFGNYNYTAANNINGGINQLYDTGGGALSLRPGDIDASGVITVADFNYLAAQTGLINVYNDADANLDGNITVADFNLWQYNASAVGISLIRY